MGRYQYVWTNSGIENKWGMFVETKDQNLNMEELHLLY